MLSNLGLCKLLSNMNIAAVLLRGECITKLSVLSIEYNIYIYIYMASNSSKNEIKISL